MRLLILTTAAVIALAGCSTTPAPQPSNQEHTPGNVQSPTTATITGTKVSGLKSPWSLAVLPDGKSGFVSERDTGEILLVNLESGNKQVVAQIADVVTTQEAGLLGLAVTPDGKQLAVMYTAEQGNKVVVMPWDGSKLGTPKTVISEIPRADFHDGGRLAFDEAEFLFVATGDATRKADAQRLDSLAGKILRMTLAGEPAPNPPFPQSPLVYSYGHRNVQGLAFDEQGQLWATEFGASDFDELNLIQPGSNYGWPEVEGPSDDDRFADPKAVWSPTSIASPSGMAIVAGDAWIASLRGETLWQVPLSDDQAGEPVPWFKEELGRLRDVVADGDDQLFVLTNNTDGRGVPKDDDDRIVGVALK